MVISFDEHYMCFLVELIHSNMGQIGHYSVVLRRDGELRYMLGSNNSDTDFNYDKHKEIIIESCREASKAIWES